MTKRAGDPLSATGRNPIHEEFAICAARKTG